MTEQDFHHHKHEKKNFIKKFILNVMKNQTLFHTVNVETIRFSKKVQKIVKKLTVVSPKDFIFCPVVLSIQVLIYRTEKNHIV